MKKEELIEDYLVYTDNGIERVHWCNVNGVKELVSPKGKVYGYVPDYFEVKRLREQLESDEMALTEGQEIIAELKAQLNEANELLSCFLDESPCRFDHNGCCQEHNSCEYGRKCIQKDLKKYLKKWGVK